MNFSRSMSLCLVVPLASACAVASSKPEPRAAYETAQKNPVESPSRPVEEGRPWSPTKTAPLTIPAQATGPGKVDIDEPKPGVEFDCVVETTSNMRDPENRLASPSGVRFLVRIDRETGMGIALEANWWDSFLKEHYQGTTKATVTLRKDEEGNFSKAANRNVTVRLIEPLTLTFIDFRKVIFEEQLSKARDGDLNSMLSIAVDYELGTNVEQDTEESLRWYKKAAGKGSTLAMTSIATHFSRLKHWEDAFTWYSKAADLKDPFAIYRVGVMHMQGWHVKKDVERGAKLVEEGATLGSVPAMHFLAILLADGEGLPKNDLHAYAWEILAASKDKQYARMRDTLERRLQPEQVTEGQRLATEWSKRLGR